jgi:hypothetical protein
MIVLTQSDDEAGAEPERDQWSYMTMPRMLVPSRMAW